MKKVKQTILKTSLFAIAFVSILGVSSCDSNMDAKDSKELADEQNADKFKGDQERDSEYLVLAAEQDLWQIHLGQLAQKNSTTPAVIQLGKMMEEDHKKALGDLQVLASQKQITIPTTITEDTKDADEKLRNVFGDSFDEQYCDMVVKRHENAVKETEKASTNAEDVDIQSWAETTLISLRAHLKHSVECQEKCKNAKSKT